jgi:hypothetical protein
MNEITKKVFKIILVTIMILSIFTCGASLLLYVWEYIDGKLLKQIIITTMIIFLFSFVPHCIITDEKKEL